MKKFLTIKFKHLHFDLLFIPTVIFAVLWDYFDFFLISFISVLIHECAHIVCAGFLKVGISRIEVRPFGVCAVLREGYINNSEKEFFIAFCGPFMSLLLAMGSMFFGGYKDDFVFKINILICAINLLPVLPLDGGRMLKSMLTYKMGILRAYNLSKKSSVVLIWVLAAFSALILYWTKFNLTYAVITAFLLSNIQSEQRNITMVTLREILENPRKIDKIKRTKVYTVLSGDKGREILRYISYDYYIILKVFKDGRILGTITETQVLNSLLDKGISVTYGEIPGMS